MKSESFRKRSEKSFNTRQRWRILRESWWDVSKSVTTNHNTKENLSSRLRCVVVVSSVGTKFLNRVISWSIHQKCPKRKHIGTQQMCAPIEQLEKSWNQFCVPDQKVDMAQRVPVGQQIFGCHMAAFISTPNNMHVTRQETNIEICEKSMKSFSVNKKNKTDFENTELILWVKQFTEHHTPMFISFFCASFSIFSFRCRMGKFWANAESLTQNKNCALTH